VTSATEGTSVTAGTAPPRNSLAGESLLFAGQQLAHWRRSSAITVQALLYPTFLLITYKLLVGKSIMRIAGTDSLYSLVPMCAMAGAMFGSLSAGLSIGAERDSGLLSQMWLLPVHRASALTGRLFAEAARTLVASALITAVGVGLGLRFHHGWLAVIPFILMPVLVGCVFAMAVIAIAVRSRGGTALFWLVVPAISLVFASSGVSAPASTPAWMRPLIALQPMAPTIGFMRALAQGGPVLSQLLVSLGWILGLAAVLGPLAVRSYRAAAESAR
jgi:ABC-2 type transport system permease protein